MQSGHDDTLEERYAIKFCFKLGKMTQKCMECFRLLLDYLAWIEHEFLSGIRDSRKVRNLWGMIRGEGGGQHSSNRVSSIFTRTIHQSTTPSLSQTIWPRWTSRQFLSLPIVKTCDFCLFPKLRGCRYETIEEMKEAVTKVIDTLTQEDFDGAFQNLL